MKIGKNIELFIKKLFYLLFRIIFRNKDATTPVDICKIRKVLIFRYDRLGDMIVSLPAIRFMKSLNANLQIDIITTPKNSSFIRNDSTFNKIYIYDGTKKSYFKIVRTARQEKYNAVFCWVFTKSTFAGVLSNLIAGRKALKITHRNEDRFKLYSSFFNVQISAERNQKLMALMLLDQVKFVFGTEYVLNNLSKEIILDNEIKKKAERYCKENELDDFVFYNISAGNPYRCFSVEKNSKIISILLKKYSDKKILLHYSPDDELKANKIAAGFNNSVLLFPIVTDMLFVSAVISKASLVVTPDTSIVHIAASFDRPAIAFYSSKDNSINEWMPFSENCVVLTVPDDKQLEELNESEILKIIP